MKLIIRDAEKEDRNFIYATWKQQLYKAKNGHYRLMDIDDYYSKINSILNDMVTLCRVRCIVPDDARNQIMGWVCCAGEKALVFVYVKTIYRENGLMKRMIESLDSPKLDYYCAITNDKHFRDYAKNHEMKYLPMEFLL